MSDTTATYHQATLTHRLPAWSLQLPPSHVTRLFNAPRKPYLDAASQPHAWYVNASADHQQALLQAITQRDVSRTAMGETLAQLKGIGTFCQPLLQQALAIDTPVDVAQYVFQPWETVIYTPPVHIEVPEGVPQQIPEPTVIAKGEPQYRSLLAAALHNFESVGDGGPLSHLQTSANEPTELPGLSLDSFIRTCRTLDLGQQYQDHLATIYQGAQGAQVLHSSIQAARDELLVHAHIARLQALLSEAGFATLQQLCEQTPAPSYAGRDVACRRIELFGTAIHEVLLVGPQDDDQVNPCIVYIPGDPLHPVREYPSVQAFGQALAQNLIQRERLQLFIGYAPQRLQPALAHALGQALFEHREADGAQSTTPRADRTLRISEHPVTGPLWQTLQASHVSRVLDDARAIAVPTTEVDANARLERLQYWLGKGLDVLNVAALFVPGLNGLMLAIGAAQVMDELFEGVRAWEAGNTAEALRHVESLALNVLSVAAIGGAAKAIEASGFVDALQSIDVAGQQKLWSTDLSAYRSDIDLPTALTPDAQGRYLHQQRSYIRIEGALYEVYGNDADHWHLRHPSDTNAYSPRLLHDGQGAWRLALESPLDWTDGQLLRRIGHRVEGLADDDLTMALRITDTSPDTLRYTHSNAAPPPALLADSLLRLRCDDQLEALIDHARHGTVDNAHHDLVMAALVELPNWPEFVRVRVFEGPEPWGDSVVYGGPDSTLVVPLQITRPQLSNGEWTSTLLDQLDATDSQALLPPDTPAEQRSQAFQALVAEHLQTRRKQLFDTLYERQQVGVSAAAQRLSGPFTSLCALAREEIASHASVLERSQLASPEQRVPLHIAEQARLLQSRQRLDRALLGVHRATLANADSQALIAGLRTARPELAASSPAELLAALVQDRAQAARLIGQTPVRPGFRSPQRLSDGRVGYPLSGRIRGLLGLDRGNDQLQELYPSLTREQRSTLAARLRLRGDLASQLNALRRERDSLDDQLMAWCRAVQDDERTHRQAFRNAILAAWRQDGGATLTLHDFTLPTLPTLNARFDHIERVVISGLRITAIPPRFFDSFPSLRSLSVTFNPDIDGTRLFDALRAMPNLRSMDLSNNTLVALPTNAPEVLAGLPRLSHLMLRRNHLTLTPEDLETLVGLRLEMLDLNQNDISLTPEMATRMGDMVHLNTLVLEGNPLGVAPNLGNLARLENLALAHCDLRAWPEGLTTLMSQQNYQLRHVDLSVNRITEVPALENVLATPFAQGVRAHRRSLRWHFNYNPLEPLTLARLREGGVSVYQELDDALEARHINWRTTGDAQQRSHWDSLFENGQNSAIADVLDRLGASDEAQRYAQTLGVRVWGMIEALGEDTALRERLEELAEQFPATCGDAGADAFSTLELEWMAYRESADADVPGPYLFNWYRRLFRRSQVNALADNLSARRGLRRQALVEEREDLPALDPLDHLSDERLLAGMVDDIETRLALRQALHGERYLDFPEPSQGMLYRETAMIDDIIIYNVEDAVTARDQNAALRQQWIAQQPAWQLFLRRTYAQQAQALLDRWATGADYLAGLHDDSQGPLPADIVQALSEALGQSPLAEDGSVLPLPSNLDEQALLLAWQHFSAARQRAEDEMLLELTASNDVNG